MRKSNAAAGALAVMIVACATPIGDPGGVDSVENQPVLACFPKAGSGRSGNDQVLSRKSEPGSGNDQVLSRKPKPGSMKKRSNIAKKQRRRSKPKITARISKLRPMAKATPITKAQPIVAAKPPEATPIPLEQLQIRMDEQLKALAELEELRREVLESLESTNGITPTLASNVRTDANRLSTGLQRELQESGYVMRQLQAELGALDATLGAEVMLASATTQKSRVTVLPSFHIRRAPPR